MDSIPIRIGSNLQRIRKQRGLSLDKVAEATGVSKGTLHQIERGDTQPTVTTVWKIATGLNLSLSSLLKDDEAAVSIVSRKEMPDVTEDNGKCKIYMLFPYDPETRIETFTITMDAGARYTSSPHNKGVSEYITVVSGAFELQVRDQVHSLHKGDAIRFAGNVTHSYINRSGEETILQVIMHYAES